MFTGRDDVAQQDIVQHGVLAGVAGMRESLGLLDASPGWSLSDELARTALVEVTRLCARTRSVYLRLLADCARRDTLATGTKARDKDGAQGRAETTAWLAERARMSTGRVRADLAEAKALDVDTGALRTLGGDLAAGAVTAEHASIAVRALAQIPVKERVTRRVDIDTQLAGNARRFTPPVTQLLARHLLAVIDPDRAKGFDVDADQRRELYLATDSTGMVVIRGQLESAGGAHVKTLIDHLCAPHRPAPVEGEPGQTEIPVVDTRTPTQRRHDALVEIARLAAGNLDAGVRAGEPPRVVVHTTPDQIAATRTRHAGTNGAGTGDAGTGDGGRGVGGRGAGSAFGVPAGAASCEATGPLSPATLARLACDAVIERILLSKGGRVLEMTSLGRLFTPAQRRALAARDGGCTWPGCDRPPSWCDAHHVIFWTDGGPTTVENGTLLCGPHHSTIHARAWTITMREGIPWFTPPPRIDPRQRPIRNTVRDAIEANRRAGQQLHLNLPLNDTDDPPDEHREPPPDDG